ncbi:MAG: PEP-CTERM sorting domain-containing protein [Myxococcota bacterium]|nr:PEP-CTERM sorting domain-containing protein [Myxococcota bacterium]
MQQAPAALSVLVALAGVIGLGPVEAQALSIDLVQSGGSYDPLRGASPGDTLILDIVVTLEPDDTLLAFDPVVDFDPAAMSVDRPNNLQIGIVTCCSSPLDPSVFATFSQIELMDPGEVSPGHYKAWGMQSRRGALGPGSLSPGRIAFVLNGIDATVGTAGSVGDPLGTFVTDIDGVDITLDPSVDLGSFQVVAVPEPSTSLLLLLGLAGLARRASRAHA